MNTESYLKVFKILFSRTLLPKVGRLPSKFNVWDSVGKAQEALSHARSDLHDQMCCDNWYGSMAECLPSIPEASGPIPI